MELTYLVMLHYHIPEAEVEMMAVSKQADLVRLAKENVIGVP